MHNVRRVIDEVANPRFVPWIARLAPLSTRHCDIDLLGRMTMVGISHMRCYEADTDPDIVPYLSASEPTIVALACPFKNDSVAAL